MLPVAWIQLQMSPVCGVGGVGEGRKGMKESSDVFSSELVHSSLSFPAMSRHAWVNAFTSGTFQKVRPLCTDQLRVFFSHSSPHLVPAAETLHHFLTLNLTLTAFLRLVLRCAL